MKRAIKWMAGGAAVLALAGCLEMGSSRTETQSSALESDPSLSITGNFGMRDGAGLPGLRFASELGLSDDQKARIHAAVDSVRHSFSAGHPRGEGRPTFQEMKARRAELRDSIWAAVMSVLDANQQSKALAIRNDIASGARPSPQTLGRVKHLTAKLSLDSAQQQAVTSILSQSQAARFHAGDSAASFDDMRAKMKAIKEDADAKILAVLTETQAALFKTLKDKRRGQGGPDDLGHHRWGRRHR